ncbi:MAG: hypothetical protein H6621_00995 [Halobacteriovoraceae bacterium]|nr:hypothetical protein [Halobacteriovoraceae bacterium]MCB9093618.1 hypothetical protein [Halobacteriovoraceae bacterium]
MKKIFKACLIGGQTSHSLSPAIYSELINRFDLPLTYELISIPPEKLQTLLPYYLREFQGINITTPYKREVFDSLKKIDNAVFDHQAERIGNCNTLLCDLPEKITVHNTDYDGIVACLSSFAEELKDQNVFIYGAGDVVSTLIYCLQDLGVSKMTVYNRGHRKMPEENIEFLTWDQYAGQIQGARLIINATPPGIFNLEVPHLNEVGSQSLIFDLNYHRENSNFYHFSQNKNLTYIDGLKMLIWQALRNIEVWFDFTMNNKQLVAEEIEHAFFN